MFKKLEIMRMAQAMAVHAGKRQAVIAENVAHADTPGYRARDLASFSDSYAAQGLELRKTRTGHVDGSMPQQAAMVDAAARQDPNGNTVSLESQMIKAGEVRHQHDLALAVYKTSLDILRMSVGRR